MAASTPVPADRVDGLGVSIWPVVNGLAKEFNAINLGQGFPNWSTPEFVKEATKKAIDDDFNQYAPSRGSPLLQEALCKTLSEGFGRELTPANFQITNGGCEGLFSAITSHLNPGDEAIVIEPHFDVYTVQIQVACAKAVPIALNPPADFATREGEVHSSEFTIDFDLLEAAVTDKTKLIIINNPHNPLGKVWSRDELERVAAVAKAHNLLVISDEVYQHIVYDDQEFVRIATLDGMWERTLTIGSAGKTFSVTGWKIGWVVGHPDLVSTSWYARLASSFTVAHPLQVGIAAAFESSLPGGPNANYWADYTADFQERRGKLMTMLREAGLKPIMPAGSYFICCDVSNISVDGSEGEEGTHDFKVVKKLMRDIGVASIPVSAFYTNPDSPYRESFVRFCFCKTDEILEAAGQALSKL